MRFRRLAPFTLKLSLFALIGVAALAQTTGEAAAGSLYDVAKISVDTTAKNAVAARTNGMAQAEMRAMEVLIGRLVPLSVQAQLPEFSREEVQELVTGVAVRKEQTSTTRYIGLLDVRFNPYSVRQFFADYAIPMREDQAPSISILPVMLSGDSVTDGAGDGWAKAWEDLDLANSITPATLVRPRADLDAGTVKAALSGDPDAYAALRNAYGYGGLVIAVGEKTDGHLRVRLAGEDAVGAVTFDQTYSASKTGAAASAAFAALESRWKTTQEGGAPPPGETAYQEGSPPVGAAAGPGAPNEVPRNVVALVEFSGLRDWQEIRSRLTQIAGLNTLEVNSMSARAAAVTFDFAGSLDNLQATLGRNGFALDERNGTLVLRSQ
ncbi:DUF2066 domain-containing protein [Methyloceanibacter sp.]|uniref:DUF2066 domain-containing protein n=1 Tax=Methyloceanibacter sp. TaxID=1965321 RepID=UPI003F506693